jgi:hypothetical protein
LNGIIPADGKLDQDTLPKIKMPNRDGFIPDAVFKMIMNRSTPAKEVGIKAAFSLGVVRAFTLMICPHTAAMQKRLLDQQDPGVARVID